ncbi:hypothetical protein ACFOZ0_12635 [Streptomyces yaanensis]|uniref:Uncharacterized protein n=1 Tax=Streptomyces yaanensis TaxID=1142239 RepID=A0ABV7SD68_9ACTN|nr:hypothetical protein [Streptomyces sp. CGMCC 4.7035]WNB99034.1 hypothetical protein Q2K21_13660 [Streptomyces sp. CGMCC 4.7035]
MRVKRPLFLLGSGLLASMAFVPGISTQTSAATDLEDAAVAARTIPDYIREPPPPNPDDTGSDVYRQRLSDVYTQGWQDGLAAAEAGKPRSIQVPSAQGHEAAVGQYYRGFVDGYDRFASTARFAISESVHAAQRQQAERARAQTQSWIERVMTEPVLTEPVQIGPLHKEQPELPPESQTGQPQSRIEPVQIEPVQIGPLHREQPELPPESQTGQPLGPTESVTPTGQTGQPLGPTESVTPTGQTGQPLAPTESVTPTHETGQQVTPEGQVAGQQLVSMEPTTPVEPQGGDFGAHDIDSQPDSFAE